MINHVSISENISSAFSTSSSRKEEPDPFKWSIRLPPRYIDDVPHLATPHCQATLKLRQQVMMFWLCPGRPAGGDEVELQWNQAEGQQQSRWLHSIPARGWSRYYRGEMGSVRRWNYFQMISNFQSKYKYNTPRTRVGPGGWDRILETKIGFLGTPISQSI